MVNCFAAPTKLYCRCQLSSIRPCLLDSWVWVVMAGCPFLPLIFSSPVTTLIRWVYCTQIGSNQNSMQRCLNQYDRSLSSYQQSDSEDQREKKTRYFDTWISHFVMYNHSVGLCLQVNRTHNHIVKNLPLDLGMASASFSAPKTFIMSYIVNSVENKT